MRTSHWALVVIATVASVACDPSHGGSSELQPVTPDRAATIEADLRAFALAVARDVTRDGPSAWRRYFADSPAFFMAAQGHLVFANSDSATQAIQELARTIKHIELRWGDGLRIDPVTPGLGVLAMPYDEVRVDAAGHRVEENGFFTGLVEHRDGRWRLRNAHWSVASPPLLVR